MDRQKFLRHYDYSVELRVEQIGPSLWGGSVYFGQMPEGMLDEPKPRDLWSCFTALSEDTAKRSAMATVKNLEPVGPWVALSEIPDEDWARSLAERGFHGYPEREGIERWSGF